MSGQHPEPTVQLPPGTQHPRRRRQLDWELIACGVRGHVLVGRDAIDLRDQDALVARDRGDARWHRCLRCDAWVALPRPMPGQRDHPPDRSEIVLPLRGKALRDKIVLRLIAVDRVTHFLVLGLLGVAVLAFTANRTHLREAFYRVLTALQGGVGGGPVQTSGHVGILRDLDRLFSLRSGTLTEVGITLIAVPAGYALSKRSKYTDILFYFFLAMIAIPPPAVLIPLVYAIRSFGLGNTYIGVVLPYIAFNIPFSVVLARAFFRAFPKDLEEAAKMDGLSDLKVFARIVLPLSSVIVVVLLIVNFPNVWNEILYATVLLQTNNVRTVQPGLLLFASAFGSQWSEIFAGMVMSSLPMIIFYIVFQKYIAKAQFLGALKG